MNLFRKILISAAGVGLGCAVFASLASAVSSPFCPLCAVPQEKGPSRSACASRATYLREAYNRSVTHAELLVSAIASQKKIILFGESHAERSKRFYYWAFRELKKKNPALDCVLVEQSKEKFQKNLDLCVKTRSCRKLRLPEFSGVKQALALGFKVKAIDAKTEFPNVPKDLMADVSRRDRFMADTTEELFKNGECHAAIMVVGGNHLRAQERGTSLSKLLKEKDLEPFRIELFSPGMNGQGCPDNRWLWRSSLNKQVCPLEMIPMQENFSFLNTPPGAKVPSQYAELPGYDDNRRAYGTWGDFDAAMALGCDDPAQASCPDQDIPNCDQ